MSSSKWRRMIGISYSAAACVTLACTVGSPVPALAEDGLGNVAEPIVRDSSASVDSQSGSVASSEKADDGLGHPSVDGNASLSDGLDVEKDPSYKGSLEEAGSDASESVPSPDSDKVDVVAPTADSEMPPTSESPNQLDSESGELTDSDTEVRNGWYDAEGLKTTAEKAVGWWKDGVRAVSQEVYDPDSASWYYVDETGSIVKNADVQLGSGADSKWVHYGTDGKMFYGELHDERGWLYYEPYTGARAHGVVNVPDGQGGAKWVYYDVNTGVMTHGEAYLNYDADHTGWYWFDQYTGAMAHGMQFIPEPNGSGKWVYYDYYTGVMAHGEAYLNYDAAHTGWYYLNPYTGAVTYGFVHLVHDDVDKWVYYGPEGADGRMRYGDQFIDGVHRWFDPQTGAADKIGYQNPFNLFQVSTRTVSLPPYAGNGIHAYVTPSRIAVDASREDCIETMISRAYDYLGSPYIWDYAGAPGVGVDCAGLVMQCLYATGMDLSPMNPWDHWYTPGHDQYANQMWDSPRFQHLSFSDRQRGDLVCYPGHIAIYLGNDQIIEAYSPAVGVRISSVYSSPNIKGVLRPFV